VTGDGASEPSALSNPSEQGEIRDAACAVVIDTTVREPTLLMGRRRADQIFLPNKWVFPGGRVDDDDRALVASFEREAFTPADLAPEIRPFVLAALRELTEEAGLVIGERAPFRGASHPGWRNYTDIGFAPSPAHLVPLARAITPPGRVRRYDTWFFAVPRTSVTAATRGDGELLDLSWVTLDEARKLDLPNITRLILEDIRTHLDHVDQIFTSGAGRMPFYNADACGFQRTLISCTAPPTPP
jgi:8-oxo-dGTP pyrophosphatase MutT (NUDIX family)